MYILLLSVGMFSGGVAFLLGVIVPYSVASAAQIASETLELERGRSVPSFQLLETWNFSALPMKMISSLVEPTSVAVRPKTVISPRNVFGLKMANLSIYAYLPLRETKLSRPLIRRLLRASGQSLVNACSWPIAVMLAQQHRFRFGRPAAVRKGSTADCRSKRSVIRTKKMAGFGRKPAIGIDH